MIHNAYLDTQVLCLIACYVEDPNSEAYKRHLARIPDYFWLAEDGMKMQVNFTKSSNLRQCLSHLNEGENSMVIPYSFRNKNGHSDVWVAKKVQKCLTIRIIIYQFKSIHSTGRTRNDHSNPSQNQSSYVKSFICVLG